MSELKPKGRKPAPSEEKLKEFERKLEKDQKIIHDLFKLNATNTRKNVSWTDEPRWEDVLHGHFFHSCDSAGKVLNYSGPANGHSHEVIVNEKDGKIISVECGPPMVMHKGKWHPYANDKHLHKIDYISSEEVVRRVNNSRAVEVMNIMKQEQNAASKNVAGMLSS
jgi:hypothetical protein